MIAGILIGHGQFPYALYEIIKSIFGEVPNFEVISNQDCSGDDLKKRIELAIEKLPASEIIIFADLFGGSCGIVSSKILRNQKTETNDKQEKLPPKQIGLVCPVNLPMLIKFCQYRNEYDFPKMLHLLEETGKKEIKVLKTANNF
ncbi:MAG: hypothetical protein N2201_01050 [candidate division WOR-3 bacterium]|nr:hypothetical protein [candidate division WOR-3 bacterium]